MRMRKHVISEEEILNELKFFKKPFPMVAVKAASEVKGLATGLVEYLKFALKNVDSLDSTFMGHIYALYLLAEYRHREAYPYVLQIYRLSEIQLHSLIGDSLTEGLPQITASIFNGNLVDLFDIFEDKSLYEFSRTSAFQASLILIPSSVAF